MMNRWLLYLLLLPALACQETSSEAIPDYPIRPVPFTQVEVRGDFWGPRLRSNREVTIPFDFAKCEETGRLDNFAIAAGLKSGEFRGRRYDDSDVFKVIEGAAYSLHTHYDPELDVFLDTLIAHIAGAQEPDGYLYTTRTINPENPVDAEPGRWTNLRHGHELYNVGHLYEAAVAHYQATGKRSLLDVALKNADLIAREFGPEKRIGVPGHQEIEIGLVKLYRTTGEQKYLDLARFFLDQRGKFEGRNPDDLLEDPTYAQDHIPVVEQTEPVGHAVRAGYLYSGMADVAAIQRDSVYIQALDLIWQSMVSKKLYLTGGIGGRRNIEGFGMDFDLPNAEAYNETCAAIASMMWNYRLFLLHGDAKYLDVLERTLYNGFLAGVSMEGDRFFYPNPLASDGVSPFNQGTATRSPWFSTACCPVNVVRFLPSLPGYVYAYRENEIFVNLYVADTAVVHMPSRSVRLQQRTNYPWEGRVRLRVQPSEADSFTISLRIPGWADNQPVPSDLYRYRYRSKRKLSLKVNGELVFPEVEKGFAKIRRYWEPGDVVELDLPLSVRRVLAHDSVVADTGKMALERGPLVYCLEGVDNGGNLDGITLPEQSQIQESFDEDLLGGMVVILGKGSGRLFKAIPYYAWSHRGPGEMAVWMPYD